MSHILYIITLLFFTLSFSKTEITWQNPLPQGNRLRDVWVVGNDTAFAVGEKGTIIRTINRGTTWEMLESHVRYDLLSISFTDALHGCVTGHGGTILMTSDGGNTWEKRESGTQDTLFRQFFLNSKFGWVAGMYNNLLRTVDSGTTWELITFDNSNIGRYAKYLFFTDSINGLGLGLHVLRTQDGGKTWIDQGNDLALYDLIFTDPANGWVTTDYISRTKDSAKTWIREHRARSTLYSISMVDTAYGWAAGGWNTIVHTSTGSTGWNRYNSPIPPDSCSYIHYDAVHFFNRTHGYITGIWGNILKVSNNDDELEVNSSRFHKDLCGFDDKIFGVFAVDSLTCYTAGYFKPDIDTARASIARTIDGGKHWEECLGGKRWDVDSSLYCLYFINRDTGWVAGAKGQILKTTDGGDTWKVTQSNTVVYLYDILFVDNQIGYACGDSGIYLKTMDSGENWQQYKMGEYLFSTLSFPSKDTGYITSNTKIYRTINSGTTWDTLNTQPPVVYMQAFFIDSRNGFVCGDYGLIYKTMDAGETWTKTNSDQITNLPLTGLHAVNKDTVYATSAFGIIIKTEDGGDTWNLVENFYCEHALFDLHFSDKRHGWTVGENGTIIKITEKEQGVGIKKKVETTINNKPQILKVIVNSQSLKIHLTINSISQTTIVLYNILGRILYDKTFRPLTKGKHTFTIPAANIPPGLYIIKVMNGNIKESLEKVLKVK